MIERLTELCADSTTAGHLTAEGCRLLCVLVKYSQNAGMHQYSVENLPDKRLHPTRAYNRALI